VPSSKRSSVPAMPRMNFAEVTFIRAIIRDF
jgi:hypothetical protein